MSTANTSGAPAAFSWAGLAGVVEDVANVVEELAPAAGAAIPGASGIAALVAAGAKFVGGAAQAAVAAGGAISSGNLATIQAADAKLQTEIVANAIAIANS